MNLVELQQYCLSKKSVTQDFPFGETTLVFRVKEKIFALTSVGDHPVTVNLKCDPDRAAELRERYDEVIPGYHMNKKHWNTVNIMGSISDKELKNMIDHSYELVVKTLSKKLREDL